MAIKKTKIKPHQILQALGNPVRWEIVDFLLYKENSSVSEINKHLVKKLKKNVSQPTISQHLKKLKACGIVKGERDKQSIYYSTRTSFRLSEIINNADYFVGV